MSAGETPTPKNLTIYRLTPRNVTDLVDHDTGDPPGDIGFFLSEKSLHAECLRDPNNIACFLAGDNVYGSWIVEVDGKFGPCECVCVCVCVLMREYVRDPMFRVSAYNRLFAFSARTDLGIHLHGGNTSQIRLLDSFQSNCLPDRLAA